MTGWRPPLFEAKRYLLNRGVRIGDQMVDPVLTRKLRTILDEAQLAELIAYVVRQESGAYVATVVDYLTRGSENLKGWTINRAVGGVGADVQIVTPKCALYWQTGTIIVPRMKLSDTVCSALHGQPLRAFIDHPLLPVDDPIATVADGPDGLVVTMDEG